MTNIKHLHGNTLWVFECGALLEEILGQRIAVIIISIGPCRFKLDNFKGSFILFTIVVSIALIFWLGND
jgi:membrane associated rhomboid family serine protease